MLLDEPTSFLDVKGKAELLTKQTITHTYSLFKRPRELGCTAVMREETRLAADMAENAADAVEEAADDILKAAEDAAEKATTTIEEATD